MALHLMNMPSSSMPGRTGAAWKEGEDKGAEGATLRILSPASSTNSLLELVDELHAPPELNSSLDGYNYEHDSMSNCHSSSAALEMLSSRRNAEFQQTETEPTHEKGGWHVTLKMVKKEPKLLSSSVNASPVKRSDKRFKITSSNNQVLSQATAILLNTEQQQQHPQEPSSSDQNLLMDSAKRDRRAEFQRWDSEESMKSAEFNIHEEERSGESNLERVVSLDNLLPPPRSQQRRDSMEIISCLKQHKDVKSNRQRRLRRGKKSHSFRSREKTPSVRFATNSQHPHRAWCLQQTIERIPPERRSCLWYSKQEITDLRLADEELHAELCQDDYAPALETALVNTSTLSEDNSESDHVDEHALVAFSFATFCQGNAARGMEQRALSSVFDTLVTRHRNAILDTQAMIRNRTLVGLEHDDHWEMLSLFSQKHARACKVLAAQLGQWDAALVELYNSHAGGTDSS